MTLDDLKLENPYLCLDAEFYSTSTPEPLDDPYLISFNPKAAERIGLDTDAVNDSRFVSLLNGTFSLEGSRAYSMCYAGHQFGHFAGRLGDGRAINLGSINGWHLQTKGSGETLYARMADGRAALPSSIREYLMSEALFHLGIPSTRALGIIGSKTKILRSPIEYAAIVMRLSPSWVRFGTFEYFHYFKAHDKLKALAEYTIKESYPHLLDDEDRFFKFFSEVLARTAKLVALWQGVGFVHGVMNTDNMSIAGLTIDLGPYAMLDDFRYGFISNKSDRAGRYSYAEQPNVSYWNLTMLAKSLSSLIDDKRMEEKLADYGAFIYPNAYADVMRQKLGLFKSLDDDKMLIEQLLRSLQDAYVDYTIFFRTLSRYDGDKSPLYDISMNPVAIDAWLSLYDERLSKETHTQVQRQEAMLKTNPKYILKNYLLEEAIILAKRGDFSLVETLLTLASHPYDELPEYEHFAKETPEEHKNLTFSCSS